MCGILENGLTHNSFYRFAFKKKKKKKKGYIENNQITGTIPTEVALMSALVEL
jgi:hypothetical protein